MEGLISPEFMNTYGEYDPTETLTLPAIADGISLTDE